MAKLIVPANVEKYDRIYRGGYDKSYPTIDLVRLEGWYLNKQPGRTLDYGAGTGANSLFLLERGYDVVAADAASKSIKLIDTKFSARPEFDDRARTCLVDPEAAELPFENDSFDYVICMSVLSLLESKQRIETMIAEFHRILKPGGRMITDINGPESDFAKRGHFVEDDVFEYTLHDDHDQPLRCYCPQTKEKFAEMFAAFEVEDLGHVSFQYAGNYGYEFIACVRKPI